MRADNTSHLRAAAHARHTAARERATRALADLQSNGMPITVAGLAKAARVARSWLYTQPDLIELIRAPAAAAAAVTQSSQESWQRRLELAHTRIRELTEENKHLRSQLAIAHGQRRHDRITALKTGSSTQNA